MFKLYKKFSTHLLNYLVFAEQIPLISFFIGIEYYKIPHTKKNKKI